MGRKNRLDSSRVDCEWTHLTLADTKSEIVLVAAFEGAPLWFVPRLEDSAVVADRVAVPVDHDLLALLRTWTRPLLQILWARSREDERNEQQQQQQIEESQSSGLSLSAAFVQRTSENKGIT